MRIFKSGLLLVSSLCVAGSAFAQSIAPASRLPDAVFIQAGAGEHTHAYCGGAQWRLRDPVQLGRHGSAAVHLELVAGRWRAQTSFDTDARQWTNQVSIVPTVRLKLNALPGWYVDTGVGPGVISPRFRNADKSFSSRFQFRSHLGVGFQIEGGASRRVHHDLEFRVEHFSNAGYVQPNPGVNLYAVRYTYLF